MAGNHTFVGVIGQALLFALGRAPAVFSEIDQATGWGALLAAAATAVGGGGLWKFLSWWREWGREQAKEARELERTRMAFEREQDKARVAESEAVWANRRVHDLALAAEMARISDSFRAAFTESSDRQRERRRRGPRSAASRGRWSAGSAWRRRAG